MAATPRISTPFTAQSTAAQVVDGVDLSGRRVIVTGGASGIGIETARALAGAGGEVTLAVRSLAAGERTARDIITTTGNEHVLAVPLDLADQASVASFTAGWDSPAWKTPEQGDEAELPANDARWLWPRAPQTRARKPGRGGPRKTRRSPQTPSSGKLSRSAESLVCVITGEQ